MSSDAAQSQTQAAVPPAVQEALERTSARLLAILVRLEALEQQGQETPNRQPRA